MFVPFCDGFHGFVRNPADEEVYSRMVAVAVARDGVLLLSDRASRQISQLSYVPSADK